MFEQTINYKNNWRYQDSDYTIMGKTMGSEMGYTAIRNDVVDDIDSEEN